MATVEQGADHDIRIPQGSGWEEDFQWMTDPDEDGNMVPIDITGMTFKGQVRRYRDRESALLAEMTFTITDAPNGKWKARIPASVSRQMQYDGYYDIDVTPSDPELAETPVKGKARLTKEVTA